MNNKTENKFGSLYKGVVVNNIDPLQTGRLLVKVADVMGDDPCIWASSASPTAGFYAVPMPGDGVWVVFLDGDPEYAVWTSSWRGSPIEVPAMALAAPPTNPPIVVQSVTQNKIILSSVPGDGITLETGLGSLGPSIKITVAGIVISDGKGAMISLTGGVVTINQGALIIK